MRRALKIAAGVVVSIVALAVVAVLVVANSSWGHEQLRTRIVSALNGVAHGVVTVGAIDGNLLDGVTLRDVSITDSLGAPFVQAREVRAGYSLLPFLSSKIELSDVVFVDPEIVLDRKPGGFWNYERIFPVDSMGPQTDTAGIQFGDWLMIRNARVVNGHLTVRVPWSPPDSVSAHIRDSVVTAALDSSSRTKVVAVAGGYQLVQEFREISGKLPLVRIAHPDYTTRLIDVDSLHMIVLAFRPPAAFVEQVHGQFELNADSVWFDAPDVRLPQSELSVEGRYTLDNGDMAMHVVATPVALAAARFLYPALPAQGTAAFDMDLNWTGNRQRYLLHDLDVKTGKAVATGELGLTIADTLELHQTNLLFAGITTKLIEQLVPGIEVPREGTISGHAKIDGALTAMQVDGDVTFNDARTGANRILAVGELGTANGVIRARNLRVTLTPIQVAMVRVAVKDFPLAGTLSGTATLNGATDSRLNATKLDLTYLENGERSSFTGTGAVRLGDVTFIALDAIAEPLSLVTVGKFAPAAELRGDVAGPIQIEGPLHDLAVRSTLRASDGGTIAAVGKLDVESDEIGYNLEVSTVLFNANVLTPKAPTMSLSAAVAARGRGFEPATMQSTVDAFVSTSTFDTLAVDSSRISLRIADGIATIDTLNVRVPGAEANVTGQLGMSSAATGTLAYRVQIDSVGKFARYLPLDTSLVTPRPGPAAEHLALLRADSALLAQKLAVARAAGVAPPATPIPIDTPPVLRSDSLAGSALIQGTASGSLDSLDVTGTLRATALVAMGSTVQNARAEYRIRGALTDSVNVEVDAVADSVSAAGFLLDSVSARGNYRNPGGTARIAVFQDSDRDYGVNAVYGIYPDRKEVRFESLRFRFDSTRWVSTQAGSVLWGQPGIEVDKLELVNGQGGRIYADGKVPSEGAANLDVQVDNFEVGDLMGLLQSDLALHGLFSVKAKVTGTSAAPLLSGVTSLADGSFGGTVVPELTAKFDYRDTKMVAEANANYDGRTIASAKGTVPMNLATSGVTGSRLLDEPASIDVRADSLPLDLVSKFTDVVSETRGYAVGKGSLRGPLKDPTIAGDLFLGNAEMRSADLGVKLTALNASIRLVGDSVVVDSISARSGGRLNVTGHLGIANIAEPSFDLTITSDRARVLDNEQGRVVADANISVKGPYDAVVVSGRARIREGILYIPKSDSREQISAGDPAVLAVGDTIGGYDNIIGRPSPLVNNLRMDLMLAVDRDTWVRSPEANVEIFSDGDLRINIDRRHGSLTLDGVVSTDRGEYEFLGKRFQLKRGSANFIGTQEINPLLQFVGEYEVKQQGVPALKIRILIGGTMLRPQLALESDAQPPIPQSDLLSYLAFGSESGSLLSGGGSSISGSNAGGGLVGTSAALATKQLASVMLGVAVNELEGSGARSLGADVFNITPANIPTEFGSGQYGAVSTFFRGTLFEYGKYFSTSTFVGLQLQGDAPPGFRVEHRFGGMRGLSLESTLQPRYFLGEPSLDSQKPPKSNAFGLFFVRRWKF